jgi:pimeloyl-ACP methyl ester carboxylesterase
MREAPTLLLLHGGPGFDHSGFMPDFARLADIAQVVYLDHRGSGRSDRGSVERWKLNQWADDIRSFCGALDIEKPIVIGQSFGAWVAMMYAVRHPEHPSKLVVSSASARPVGERSFIMFERLGGAVAREAAVAFWTNPGPDTRNDYFQHCMPLCTRKRPLSAKPRPSALLLRRRIEDARPSASTAAHQMSNSGYRRRG